MKSLLLIISIVIPSIIIISCVNIRIAETETYYETEYKTEYRTETYTELEDILSPASQWSTLIDFTDEGPSCFGAKALRNGTTYFYGYVVDNNGSECNPNQIEITLSPMTSGSLGIYNINGPLSTMGPHVWEWLSPYQSDEWNISTSIAHRLNVISVPAHTIYYEPVSEDIKNEITFTIRGLSRSAFVVLINTLEESPLDNVILVSGYGRTERKMVTRERQVPYQVPVQVEKQRTIMQIKKVPFWEAIFH